MNKKTFIYIITAALVCSALGGSVFAMESSGYQSQSGVESAPRLQKNFCTNLSGFSKIKDARLAEWDKNLGAKRTERSMNIDNRRENREEKLGEVRANADAKRATSYGKMEAKAATEEQKEAIKKFKEAVEAAVTARRTAIDDAVKAYREGLDSAITERKAALDQALNTFKQMVKNTENNAASECSAGKDPAQVRSRFQETVAAARADYKEARLGVINVGESVNALNEVRKAAFEKAKEDFKAAFEAAKNDLKETFPLKGAENSSNMNE